MSDNEKSDYLDYPEPFVNFFRFSKNICKKKKIEICEPNYFLENRYSNDNFLLNDSWEGKCECKNILEEKNLKEMSETEKSAKENYTKKDVKEGRKLFDIIHKIQNNKYCQSFELFVKKYYLSKKQSYITILRKNIEELFNFNDEYLVPLSQFKVENLYDSSNITIKLRNSNNSLNFGFFRQPRAEELEISIENHDWLILFTTIKYTLFKKISKKISFLFF